MKDKMHEKWAPYIQKFVQVPSCKLNEYWKFACSNLYVCSLREKKKEKESDRYIWNHRFFSAVINIQGSHSF